MGDGTGEKGPAGEGAPATGVMKNDGGGGGLGRGGGWRGKNVGGNEGTPHPHSPKEGKSRATRRGRL
jgi:hypothetical protein